MEAFILLFAAAVLGVSFMDTGSNDDDVAQDEDIVSDPIPEPGPSPDPDPEPGPTPPPGSDPEPSPIPTPVDDDLITITSNANINTGDGNDTLRLSEDLTDPVRVTIDAGNGDDLVDLIREDIADDPLTSDGTRADFANVDGGAGNDTISVFGEGLVLNGGEGDDVILAREGVATVNGGDGDDQLTGIIFNTDTVLFDGGAGEDTIDATQLENGSVRGGDDNDLIQMAGVGSGGAGYVLNVNADAGDDTISYDNTETIYFPEDAQPHRAAGGDGADTFALRLSEGARLVGAADESADVAIETLSILDFETGVDTVEVDASPAGTGFTLASGQLEEVDGETSLVLLFESTDPAIGDREISVSFGSAEINLSDITFTGPAGFVVTT